MSKATASALNGLVIAAATALVSSGVISGHDVAVWQPVVVALVSFLGVVGVRSALPPK